MRLFPYIAILMVAALSVACVPENEPGPMLQDLALKITFPEDPEAIPDYRHITLPTKAGDVARLRYTVLIWQYENESALGIRPDYSCTFQRSVLFDPDTTILLSVKPAKYHVAAWVDWFGGDAGAGYDCSDPEYIAIPEDYTFGQHARDAYTFVTDYDVSDIYTAGQPDSETVVLQRPVAKLRFVTPEVITFQSQTGLYPSEMRATLRYCQPLPDGYNVLLDMPVGSRSDILLTGEPYLDATGELVFVSDYIFLSDELESVSVEFTLTDLSGQELIVYSGSIPLRKRHVTTVSFRKNHGGIGISPGFDGEIEIIID